MIDANGRGRMSKNNKKISAPRVSWIIHNGEIQEGLNVLHLCSNAICTNPQHLYLGTQKENVRDAVLAGRAKGNKSVLSRQQAIEIKKLIKEGFSIKYLSKKYNVNGSVISNIRRNKIWKHITIDTNETTINNPSNNNNNIGS